MFRDEPVELALQCAANEIESDTDTIATMAGAYLGGISSDAPKWAIQDREYISQEARRLAAIAAGDGHDAFFYPDIGIWNPPSSQAVAIGRLDAGLGIIGLGQLTPLGKEYVAGDAAWQWFKLSFGQTVLAKRKIRDLSLISPDQLPRERKSESKPNRAPSFEASSVGKNSIPVQESFQLSNNIDLRGRQLLEFPSIDQLTDDVISSDFNDEVLGRVLNKCIDLTQSIDMTVAVAAIVAKAKLARQRRKR
jgi:hypothetical protein